MTDLEHSQYMTKGAGKDLVWNNYDTELGGGRVYRGQWTKDRLTYCGIGEIKYKDGSVYAGLTSGNQPNGKGRWVLPDGDIYQGEIVNGNFSGYGVYYDV